MITVGKIGYLQVLQKQVDFMNMLKIEIQI